MRSPTPSRPSSSQSEPRPLPDTLIAELRALVASRRRKLITAVVALVVVGGGIASGLALTASAPPASCSSSSFTQGAYTGPGGAARWVDSSYYNPNVSDAYPVGAYAARSNEGGGFRDPAFVANCRWAYGRIKAGRLALFAAYYVYRPRQNSLALLESQIGTPFPGLVVMVDVESWGGQIKGDHSAAINAEVRSLAVWLGSERRVIGYGNYRDLAKIWPHRNGTRVIVADYSDSPDRTVLGRVAGAIGRQYTATGTVAPFGRPVDVNRSPLSVSALASTLGVPVVIPPKPVASP